jgi:pSer/pThr/pTyr-binding forkhead associated (FHA) protein
MLMTTKVTLTVKNGSLAGTTYEMEGRRLCRVGRGAECEIRLPGVFEFLRISRHHCLISLAPPHVRVCDCGSRNGTHLNGMQIGRPQAWHLPPNILSAPCQDYELTDGDELEVGDTVFQVTIDKPARDPSGRLHDTCVCV